MYPGKIVDDLAYAGGGGAIDQHPSLGNQRPDIRGVDTAVLPQVSIQPFAVRTHGLAQDVLRQRFGHLDAVDARRQDSPGITGAFTGGVEAPGIDALVIASPADADRR